MPHLVLDGLTKRFGQWTAVDAISLTVEKGELISLLGPSGCGKTTTLQMIAGFVEPTAGSILLDGGNLLAEKPSRRGLGIVFQSYALFPHMTAAENIAFGLEMRGMERAAREQRVRAALDLVGLSALGDRHPRRMSGGQQQRVALARALVVEPRLLLLDEPLSNLDAKMREEMQIELRRIQRSVGTTMILVTHDQSEAMALSDRMVVMNKGRVEQVGQPQEVYDRPTSAFVAGFLGRTNLFPAMVERSGGHGRVDIGGAVWSVPDETPAGRVVIALRPEKTVFTDGDGLGGRIKARVFQGNQWLFEVESAFGPLCVVRPHDGAALPSEGDAISIGWNAADLRVLSAEGGPA